MQGVTEQQSAWAGPEHVKLKTGEIVDVRELNWSEAIAFVRMLQAHIAKLQDKDGNVRLNAETLSGIASGVDEIGQYLVSKATGLTPEKIGQLPASSALTLLDASIQATLNDGTIDILKNMGARVKRAFQKDSAVTAKAKTGVGSMPQLPMP